MEQRLGRYIIETKLGEGTFAYVYRAKDEELDRHVALKVLKPAWLSDPTAIARFKQEARTMAKLDRNPHIALIYDVGESEGQVYLAQLLVDGETLAARLARGPLSWLEILNILRPIASALDYAHREGVVHRDIKPSNILLDRTSHAFLGDFGLVRAAEGSASLSTSIGGVKGTASYIPPEVWEGGEADATSDIYALSCVIFEMATGQVLFEGSSMMAVMRQHDRGPQFPENWPAGISPGITGVLQRGLAANPDDRFQGVNALLAAMEALPTPSVSDEAALAQPISPPPSAEAAALWLVSSTGQNYEVKPGILTLGRLADCDIQLDDRLASRQHARLEFDGQQCVVYDQDSANGTFINERRVGPEGQPFSVDDRLRIGNTSFSLSTTISDSTVPPPVAPVEIQEQPTVMDAVVVPVAAATAEPPSAAPPDTVTTAPPPSPPPPKRRSKTGPVLAVLGIGGLLVLIACVILFFVFWPDGPAVVDNGSTNTPTARSEPSLDEDTPTLTDTPDEPFEGQSTSPTDTLTPTPTDTPEESSENPTIPPTHTFTPTPTDVPPPPTHTPTPTATPTEIPPQPVLSWISIPGGNFTMGSSDPDIQAAVADCNVYEGNCQTDWFGSETPQRTESTGAFEIVRYEITNAQYNACVNAGVCRAPQEISSDNSVAYNAGFFDDNKPVVTISVGDAATFCNWVGGRLPGEREWEKAARGTDGRRYPWGNTLDLGRANLFSSGPKNVGSYSNGASPYGVMDMAGNVAEFTTDNVVRGGSWKNFPHHGRTTQRSTGTWLTGSFVNFDIGFRCVR